MGTILSQTLAKENEKRMLRGEEGPLIEMDMAESEKRMQGMALDGQNGASQSNEQTHKTEDISSNIEGELPTTTMPSRMVGSNSSNQTSSTPQNSSTTSDPNSTSTSLSSIDSEGRVIFQTASARIRSMSRIHEIQGDEDRSSTSLYDIETLSKRKNHAEKLEGSKWDESYYLDNYVDPEKEISPLLSWTNPAFKSINSTDQRQTSPNFEDLPPSKRSNLLALTSVLFSYLYDLRCNLGDISSNVESGYTISKLSRCMSCECMPYIQPSPAKADLTQNSEVKEILRESFRRALVVPLYRSWELCEKVLKDVENLLGGSVEARKQINKALKSIEKSMELTQENNGGREEILKSYVESVRGIRKWIEKTQTEEIDSSSLVTNEELCSLGKLIWESRPKKENVGKNQVWKVNEDGLSLEFEEGEDIWEIELLEQCARQVEEEEEP